ncbi:molybdate ABC transporter substrate-binding protein [Mycobacterium sp. M1]|uniref:Molybdate ABC transporter substrate-binding protein n=1 Tax=Mycolicibacter acidiphilus TaxID=2835306 RepID=A0ABS5REJ4_9MYCO|nr:molybdate ABC transporter substrate-binding protein [Mycolicibacter acidiphilus]MBS9532702.1 molybdate ABC transporter substrate-binding protein [Mycolicibacter acidiphilus]
MWRARILTVVLSGLLAASLPGCAGPHRQPASITVFAAASLRSTFTEIAERFQAAHPGATVEFNFGGSSDLATQLIEGADADVFASANTAQMDKVVQARGLISREVPFATNTLVIVTAPGNPHRVASFADLARPGLAVVVCQRPVPCGAATGKVEAATGVDVHAVSEEPDVTDVLNKVTTGQADAGVVYRTDAIGAGGKVETVEFPEAAQAVNTYPIGRPKDSAHADLAGEFVDLVTGEQGRQILTAAGFGKP